MRSGEPAGGASKLFQPWRCAQYGVVLGRVRYRSHRSILPPCFRVFAGQLSRFFVDQVCFFEIDFVFWFRIFLIRDTGGIVYLGIA